MVRTLPSSYSAQWRSGYQGDGWCHGGASVDVHVAGEGAEFICQSRRSSPGYQQTVQRYRTQHRCKFSTMKVSHRCTVWI